MKKLDASTVTANEFAAYRKMQRSGKFNMVIQALDASYAARITFLKYLAIIDNFTELLRKFEGANH